MGTFGSSRPKVGRARSYADSSTSVADKEVKTEPLKKVSIPYFQFINILQGKTGRWIEGETNAHGLYSDGVSSCKILCVAGRLKSGKRAISLTHLDETVVVSDLKSEVKWIHEITNSVIFHNSDELRMHPPRYWYFKHVFCKEIRSIFGDVEFREFTHDCDGIWIMFRPQADYEIKVDLVNSKELPDLPIVLVNHEKAVDIFAFSQTNSMCAEIESEFRMCELYYTDKIIPKDDYQVEYEGKIQSEWDVNTSLSTPLDLKRLMFDGHVFLPMGYHDSHLSDFAKSVFEKLNPPETKTYEQFEQAVAEVLHGLEQQKFSNFPQHEMQSWGADRQTTGLAQNYVQALKLEAFINLPHEYLGKVGLYNRKFNHARELQLIEKEVYKHFNRASYSSSDGSVMFFSFSKYATPQHPFGPFADFFCGNNAYEELNKFTKMIRSTDLGISRHESKTQNV